MNAPVGEFDLLDCFPIAVRDNEDYVPWEDDFERFLWSVDNIHKHRVDVTTPLNYAVIYAWVLENPFRYAEPVQFVLRPGTVEWTALGVPWKCLKGALEVP